MPAGRRLVVSLWLAGCALAAVVAVRTNYVADLSAFLPSAPTAEQAALLDPLKEGAAARLVIASIRGHGGGARLKAEASRRLADKLRASGEFASVDNGDREAASAGYGDAGRFVFEHRYALSPAVDEARFRSDGLRDAIDSTLSLLGTPAGALVKPILLRDPTGETLRIAETLTPSQAPKMESGVWVSRSGSDPVLVLTTRAPGADLDGQERALAAARRAFADTAQSLAREIAATKAGLQLELTGAPVFGVASRERIKGEVERLSILGTIVVVGLLGITFASLRALLVAMLPVLTGVLAGIAATSLVYGQVHGMTLGFGTTLIGEAVDYAIYYLVQTQSARGAAGVPGASASAPARWVRESWPTVRLGMLTTVIGFAALVFAGFPGLAQLGVFSIAGLLAAAATTRFVFPVIVPNGAPGVGLRRRLGRFMQAAARLLPRTRYVAGALALAGAAALVVLPSPWRGQLTDLSPVSAVELERDARLRADVGAPDAGTLVVVSADSEAAVLDAAEQVGTRLDVLVRAGALDGYASPARFLPSPATQQRRLAALPDGDTLRRSLAAATEGGALPASRLDAFVADVAAARSAAPFDRAALANTPLATAVDALMLPARDGKPWRAFINLQPAAGATLDAARVAAALAGVPGVRLVAIKGELDAIYARYIERATWQAGLGAAAVLALLAFSLRSARRLLAVSLPLAAACLVVLGALAASGTALGILHLVGLLLTVAIGSNYALFFDHLRHDAKTSDAGDDADLDTLASLLLANLTTVISFALLATSQIPVLQAVGVVVAPGALLGLVFAAAFIGPRQHGIGPRQHGVGHARP